MIKHIIAFSVRTKGLVFAATALVVIWGIVSAVRLPIDAVPDITNHQVQIVTTAPALAPQEVEQFITYPIELSVANVAGVEEVRSISRYGLSVVTVIFDDALDPLVARQRINEQLDQAAGSIPADIGRPSLMPVTTGLGEIYQYTLEVDPGYTYSLTELRSLHDWQIKRQLAGIPGVVELSSFGGMLKQYEVAVHLGRLQEVGLTLADVFAAVQAGHQNAGGAYIEKGARATYIRLEGLYTSLEDIGNVALKSPEYGIPVLVKDIAHVRYGAAPRYGALTRDGKGEAVGGIVLMLKGANSYEVTQAIEERVASIASSLPPGVHIEPYLNRSDLVGRALSTVQTNLLEGGLIVIFVLILLLGNLRAGLVVASVIPLSLLFALGCMQFFSVSANLMSLGAIDFGIVVDGAVIIVEAVLATLFANKVVHQKDREELVIESASSIYQSAAFGVVIILVVFVPILTLTGIEGKMFRPMAQTVVFALVGALLFSLTYVPALSALVLHAEEEENRSERFMRKLRNRYAVVLEKGLGAMHKVLALSVALFVAAIFAFQQLGSVFIPNLEEGDLAMQVSIPTGSNLTEMVRITTEAEQQLMNDFPEVLHVVSKIGTAEVPTDPMPMEAADVMILLKPKSEWVSAKTREELVEKMDASLQNVWGALFEFTQPIQLRFNELISGSKSDIALQLYGDDLDTLSALAQRMANVVEPIEGAVDIKVEATQGMRFQRWVPQRAAMAFHGVQLAEVSQLIEHAYAGGLAGTMYEGQQRFDIAVRVAEPFRTDIAGQALSLKTSSGHLVPLAAVASHKEVEGPSQISRSQASRRISVGINVRGRDIASVVADIEAALSQNVVLPTGYRLHIGGDFENLRAAVKRLQIAVPAALILIFVLLFLTFKSVPYAMLIFTAIPLSAVGGVAALYARGMPFSISAGIGFIALFGVVVLNGIVLAGRIRQLHSLGWSWKEAVVQGSADRLRPILMTATVAALGFVPMAFSVSAGAEVQKPLATVVIGGLISATLLTLGVLPMLFVKFEKRLTKGLAAFLVAVTFTSGLHAQSPSLFDAQKAAVEHHVEAQRAFKLLETTKLSSTSTLGNSQLQVQRGQMNGVEQDYYVAVEQPLGSLSKTLALRKEKTEAIGLREAEAELVVRGVCREVAEQYAAFQVASERVRFLDHMVLKSQGDAERIRLRVQAGEWSEQEGQMALLALQQWHVERAKSLGEVARIREHLSWQTGLDWPELGQTFHGSLALGVLDSSMHPAFEAVGARRHALAVASLTVAKTQAFAPDWRIGAFQQQMNSVPGFRGLSVGVQLPIAPSEQRARQIQKVESDWMDVEAASQMAQYRHEYRAARVSYQEWATVWTAYQSTTPWTSVASEWQAQWQAGEIDFHTYRTAMWALYDQVQSYLECAQNVQSTHAVLLYYSAEAPFGQ
jgi:cobalt-zinc-cadmium resistance protein CzcA